MIGHSTTECSGQTTASVVGVEATEAEAEGVASVVAVRTSAWAASSFR